MDNLKLMQTKVIPTLLNILARDRVELSQNSSDPVWVSKHINELLNHDYMMADFMANVFEKDGTYPEFKGLSVSEILDTFMKSYLEVCQEEEEQSADQLFSHGYA